MAGSPIEQSAFGGDEVKSGVCLHAPDNADVNFVLGNLRLDQGTKSAAESYYLAALSLDPNHEGVYNNLGILALQGKRWSLAAGFFAKALRGRSATRKPITWFAEAHFKAGDIESANAEIDVAIRLQPDQAEFKELKQQIESGAP